MFVSRIFCHWHSLAPRFGTKREPFRPFSRFVQASMAARLRTNGKSLGKLFRGRFHVFNPISLIFSA